MAEPIDVPVEKIDLSFESGGHPGCVPAHVAGAEHHDPGGADTGGTAQQHAPTAVVALEEMGADLHAHPACHLTHGCEQRQ